MIFVPFLIMSFFSGDLFRYNMFSCLCSFSKRRWIRAGPGGCGLELQRRGEGRGDTAPATDCSGSRRLQRNSVAKTA